MPRRTNQFQRLVALLNATLAGQAQVTESAMLRDKVTGEEREVDILIRTRAGTYDVAIGIEVVGWSRPAGTPWIEKMRAKHANLPVDKLILVSESGFAKPAVKKATFYNIETLQIQDALSTDWSLLSKLESSGVFETVTMNFKCSFIIRLEDDKLEQIDAPLSTVATTGGATVTLDQLVRTLLDQQEFRDTLYPHVKSAEEHDFWISYTQPTPIAEVSHNGQRGEVTELRIGLKVTKRQSPVSFASGTYKSVPFVSGVGRDGEAPLQFVLAKKPDGQVTGYLFDSAGVRTLTATSDT